MVDRVSVAIIIGGNLCAVLRDDLCACIQSEGLALDYDGEDFTEADFPANGTLHLFAHEVAWGRAQALENFCIRNAMPFTRWSGGSASQFGAERVVFTGHGDPQIFAADEDASVVIGADKVAQLGSYEAIMAYFAAADFEVLPLRFLP